MHRQFIRRRMFVVVLLSTWSLIAGAQRESAGDSAAVLIRQFMAGSGVPGIAVSVGRDDRIIWSDGFGYADVEQRVPVWPAVTRFRVGSVAKPMTATALAELYEEGRVDLDAPVQKYVPSFPKKAKGVVTTRELAGHLAGVRHYRGAEFLSQKHYDTVLEGLTIFQDDTLLFEPGTKYSYSSYGWNLVSAVVERAAGEDFLRFMRERVFLPMGMLHTTPDYVSDIIDNRTRYYELQEGRLRNAPPVDNSYKWAGGGFLSTSEDLLRFGFAFLNPTVLKAATVKMLWTSQKTASGEETHYGIGWASGTDAMGHRWVGHGGGSVGGTTFFRIFPDSGVIVVMIANMSEVRYGSLGNQIAALFM